MRARLAVLAPELPSLSATFVYREVDALRELGLPVTTHALHAPEHPALDPAAAVHRERTRLLYPAPLELLADAARSVLCHPVAALRTLGSAASDVLRGRFAQPRQRLRVPAQLLAGLALAHRLRREGITHLHVQFAHSPATVGMYAALAADLPFSLTAHANDLVVQAALLRQKLERARPFRIISEASRRLLAEAAGPALADRAVVIRCGVDLQALAMRTAPPDDSAPCLLAVARLVPKKGLDVLLEAFARLASEHPRLRLVLAGDGPERGRLELLALRLGLLERVDLLGAVGPERLHRLLEQARAFALPCREARDGDVDGIPVVLMEAMARGVPVVSTPVAGVPELVEDGRSGLLVPAEDPEALADALGRLLDDPALAARLAAGARERVEQLHDVRGNTLRLLRSILSDADAPVPRSGALREPPSPPSPMGPPHTLSPCAAPSCVDAGPARLLVVTPARNEAAYLPAAIEAMVAQTVRPWRWVIVDDGSDDGTGELAEAAARDHDWIRVVRREDRGFRKLGGGVVHAFEAGRAAVRGEHDVLAKVDADVVFGPRYVERLLRRFAEDPGLGSASGKVFLEEQGRLREEFMIDDMVAGQWKAWRRECFEDIGGLVPAVMWDGIDFHRARQRGWRTRSFQDPELRIVHRRLMGSSDRSVYRGRLRWGAGQWFMGSHPLYLLASALFRCHERPRLVGGLLILVGFLRAALRGEARYPDLDFRRGLRRWQLARLKRLVLRGRVR